MTRIVKKIRLNWRTVLLVLIGVFVAGCTQDKSEVSSGGGASIVTSDGGTQSSVNAGVYAGTLSILFRGDAITSRSVTKNATLIISNDGSGTLSLDGDVVSGAINGDSFGFSVRFVEVKDLVECQADALIAGSINGNIATGNVSGSGQCGILSVDESVTVSGTLLVSK